MTFLCLIFPLLYWDGLIEASSAPKWIVLSLVLPIVYWRTEARMPLLIALFLGWCALSLTWSTSWPDGLDQLWHFTLLGMAYAIGSRVNIRRCCAAFAVGMAINGAVAFGQTRGWAAVAWIQQGASPAGLMVNKNTLAEAGLMAVVMTISMGPRWLALACLPAWIVPMSWNALLAGAALAAWRLWRVSRVLTVILALAAAWGAHRALPEIPDSWDGRLSLYLNSLAMVADRPLGWGLGSFWSAYPPYHDAVRETGTTGYTMNSRSETAHDDLLTLAVETGLPGVAAMVGLGLLLARRRDPRAWALAAFVLLGLFAFPLYMPAQAFMAALLAGAVGGRRVALRDEPRDRPLPLHADRRRAA